MFYKPAIRPQLLFIRPRLGEGEASTAPPATPTTAPTPQPESQSLGEKLGNFLAVPAGLFGTYMGYMNHQSIGWAVLYGILGYTFPLFTIPIMGAQMVLSKKGAAKKK